MPHRISGLIHFLRSLAKAEDSDVASSAEGPKTEPELDIGMAMTVYTRNSDGRLVEMREPFSDQDKDPTAVMKPWPTKQ